MAKIHRTRDVHQQIPAHERLIDLFHFFADWEIVPFATAFAASAQAESSQAFQLPGAPYSLAVETHGAGALAQHLHRIAFAQHAFHEHGTVHTGHAVVSLRYLF